MNEQHQPTEPTDVPRTEDQGEGDVSRSGSSGRKAPTPEPVETLADLFTLKGANPTRLFRHLAQEERWSFHPDDIMAALELLPEKDPHL